MDVIKNQKKIFQICFQPGLDSRNFCATLTKSFVLNRHTATQLRKMTKGAPLLAERQL